jgi:glyoxylase-like metal-dependent hydrolase (beta-lactamase superfamily II)
MGRLPWPSPSLAPESAHTMRPSPEPQPAFAANQTPPPRPESAEERALHYPLARQLPGPANTLSVAPGVFWLRMPLPFALDHINLWLLRDELDGVPGWTVVDCGIDNPPTRALWEQLFATVLDGLPVLRVVVTHMHPDHIGLAHWLCERWRRGAGAQAQDCRLWISGTDWAAARLATQVDTAYGGAQAARFMALHGVTDAATLREVGERSNHFGGLVPQVPKQYRRLMDGFDLRINGKAWRCISGYGHAPEHIALYNAQDSVLIGGDMVLPRISTNVSVLNLEPESNPLQLYLDSLDRLRGLPQDTLVLPSHGRPFTGLHTRIDQLHEHHRLRLAEVLAACTAQAGSAADMLPVMFKRQLDVHQTTFALGESIAHLHLLLERGDLRRALGADGVMRFSPPV